MKKFRVLIVLFILLTIIFFQFNDIKIKASTFKPYQMQVVSNYVNIRKFPSLNSKIVGKYTKGTVFTVIGKSGSFLKTNKGYVYNSSKYIKIYSSNNGQAFKGYKVVIKAPTLNIRKLPSLSSPIVGKYYKGNIVTIIGASGNFLRTNKGYIHKDYVEVYTPNRDENPLVGRYIKIKEDIFMLKETDGTLSDRLLLKDETYKILGVEGDYYKIIMGSLVGYIHKDNVILLNEVPNKKITLAWQYVYDYKRNIYTYDEDTDYVNIKSSQIGLDVLSPTWFDIEGDYKDPANIYVVDNASSEYVKLAHRNGYEVWPRFAEFDAERAYVVFTNPTVRKRVVDRIVYLAKYYDVDGINIDFEALGMKNKDLFTDFVKDLSTELKKYNMVVSVDVTRISSSDTWSRWYDRQALINYVDYMILMAYDEFVAESKTPGSVGSYPWVKSSIEEFLNLGIPKEKLILGVPFYLRLYKTVTINNPYDTIAITSSNVPIYVNPNTSSIKITITTRGNSYKLLEELTSWYKVDVDGKIGYIQKSYAMKILANKPTDVVVSSQAIATQKAYELMNQYNGKVYFDNRAKQNVIEYNLEGYKYIVWLEDETSMAWRIDFIRQYDLAGCGAWSLGWENRSLWNIIKEKLK
ncbi:MAG: glycosyl hydrolase family 18 protein [Caloramator sp.]|nr:glycosyl hydrolase family 18 protein [Caloramator sp.]